MKESTEFDAFADIYDAWTDSAPITADNLGFYVEEFTSERGPVIELGVGNGRIAIEAARRGKAILGVDSSEKMLELCRERATEAGVMDRLTLLRADFRDFELPEPAALIAIPFHSIGHLVGLDEKRACFAHVRDRLAPGGRFVFDHFVFDARYVRNEGTPTLRAEYRDAATGNDVLLWTANTYDIPAQSTDIRAISEELDSDGVVTRRKVRRLSFSWIDPEQVSALLKETGFEIEALYGDFERGPFDPEPASEGGSGSQVWTAKRPS